MTDYRRIHMLNATWFFTVNLAERQNNHLLVERIESLRTAFRYVKEFVGWAGFFAHQLASPRLFRVGKKALPTLPSWPYSSFHQFVAQGVYPAAWGLFGGSLTFMPMNNANHTRGYNAPPYVGSIL